MRGLKKFLVSLLAILLVASMVLPMASCKEQKKEPTVTEPTLPPTSPATYTYEDSVPTLSTCWNPHVAEKESDRYPIQFLTTGLYGFFYNDGYLYTVEGRNPFESYKAVPEMAAELPVDVTETVKTNAIYGIPTDATSGYAYLIKLNPNAKWENGEAINADTYVDSMKRLLDPDLQNAHASDYFEGDFAIANAKNYYYQGATVYHPIRVTATEFLANGGTVDQLYVDLDFLGMVGAKDENGNEAPQWISVLDETLYFDPYFESDPEHPDAWISAKKLYDSMLAPGCVYERYSPTYLGVAVNYEDNYGFANVGIYKQSEYEMVLVLEKPLAGFDLLYALTENWIVYLPYYDTSPETYNTSLETTMSYGPYKLTDFLAKKEMTFEKNSNWFGYTDGKHKYKDPVNGEIYDMYQTTKIHCQVVTEAQSRLAKFLRGELMTYGLVSEDFDEYRDSAYAYATPSPCVLFFVLGGYLEKIQEREAKTSFDESQYDIETVTLQSFRRALFLSFNREAFCESVWSSRTAGYGLIGPNYIYDLETGAKYRDTPQAKKVLCELYGVDYTAAPFNGDLDAAVASITGQNVTEAKELFTQAFHDAIAAGYITDTDGDGKSDQVIYLESASNISVTSHFITNVLPHLNEKLAEILVGTPFEGKVEIFDDSGICTDYWTPPVAAGLAEIGMEGQTGSELDPYALTDFYTNPEHQFDKNWFDSSSVSFTLTLNTAKIGEPENIQDVTLTLRQWSDALNGKTVTVNGVDYNFGDGIADVNTRLEILAKIESTVLNTYSYIPMLQDGSVSLISMKAYYVLDEYCPIMERGGIAYMKYNYNDAEWEAYVASQPNGILRY